jgi:hypothetical protein
LKKAVQFAEIAFSSAVTLELAEDVAAGVAAADVAAGAELGAELLPVPLLPHAVKPPPTAQASRIQEANLVVFTQTFCSFGRLPTSQTLTAVSDAWFAHSRASAAAWSGTYVCISRGTRT